MDKWDILEAVIVGVLTALIDVGLSQLTGQYLPVGLGMGILYFKIRTISKEG